MASSISTRTVACQRLFARCLSIHVFNELDWFENRQGEFGLWESGLRAADVGRASLDHRVRDRPDVRELICDLLDGLSEALEDCLRTSESKPLRSPTAATAAYSKTPSKTDGSDVSAQANKSDLIPGVEQTNDGFSEQAFNIKTILGQLTRISTAIRRSGAKFRHEKADMALQEQNFEEFKAHLTFIILMPAIENYSHGSSDGDAIRLRISDQGRLTTVQKRLIQANIIRRNRIIFATRSMKQIKNQDPQQNKLPEIAELPFLNPESTEYFKIMQRQLIADGLHPLPALPSSIITSSIAQSSTEIGSEFGLQAVPHKKNTPSTMTRITQTGDHQDYPTCPVPVSDEVLQCPYCADLLPVEYAKNKSRWKGHVAQDILPYMCIFEDCETPKNMYLTSDELVKHMRSHHSVPRWICSYCSSKSEGHQQFVFESPAEWESHMQQAHIAAFTPAQLPALSRVSRRNMLDTLSCPLCAYTAGISRPTLDDHIVQHLHEFALRCLPWVTNGSDGESINASSSHGSRLSAFVGQDFDDGKLEFYNLSGVECLTDLLNNVMEIIRHLKASNSPASVRISGLFAQAGLWDRTESAIQNSQKDSSQVELSRDLTEDFWGNYILRIGQILRQLSSIDNTMLDDMEVAQEAKETLEWELDDLDAMLLRGQQGKHNLIIISCVATISRKRLQLCHV
ncbi:hypothetical protein V8C40DRAFT_238033 [Trichoderma camerunense]